MSILKELESRGCAGLELDQGTVEWVERTAKETGFLIVVDGSRIDVETFASPEATPERLRGAPIIMVRHCDPPVRIWKVESQIVYVVTQNEIESSHVEAVYADGAKAEKFADSFDDPEYGEYGHVAEMRVE